MRSPKSINSNNNPQTVVVTYKKSPFRFFRKSKSHEDQTTYKDFCGGDSTVYDGEIYHDMMHSSPTEMKLVKKNPLLKKIIFDSTH